MITLNYPELRELVLDASTPTNIITDWLEDQGVGLSDVLRLYAGNREHRYLDGIPLETLVDYLVRTRPNELSPYPVGMGDNTRMLLSYEVHRYGIPDVSIYGTHLRLSRCRESQGTVSSSIKLPECKGPLRVFSYQRDPEDQQMKLIPGLNFEPSGKEFQPCCENIRKAQLYHHCFSQEHCQNLISSSLIGEDVPPDAKYFADMAVRNSKKLVLNLFPEVVIGEVIAPNYIQWVRENPSPTEEEILEANR